MWRFIKWTFLSLVALAVLGGAGGIILVNSVDLTEYRREIAAEVEAITGRKLIIRGKIEKHVLTLTPAIVINDVTFANAKWSQRPHMLKAKKIRLVVRLLPLIGGNIDIKRFDLVGADIILETNKADRGNWVLGTAAPAAGGAAAGKKPAATGVLGLNPDDVPFIEKVRIVDSTFTYIDGRTGLQSKFGLQDVRFDAPTRNAPVEVLIKGNINGTPVTTEATLGSYDAFLRMTPKYPVNVSIKYGRTDITGELVGDLSGKRIKVTGALTSARISLDELGNVGGSAPGRTRSRYMFSPDPLPIGLLRALDLDLSVEAGELIVGRNPIKKFRAKVTLNDGDLRIRDLAAGVHGGNLGGRVRLDASRPTPGVYVNVDVKRIPLREVTQLLFEQAVIASTMNAKINVTGQGKSMRRIASTLTGRVNVVLGPGPIRSQLLGLLSKNIASVLSGSGGGLSITRGIINLRFRNGHGSTAAVVDTTRITFCGHGVVSTRNEAMNVLVINNPKGLAVSNLAALVPVRVVGSLRRPTVRPEPGGIPKELGKTVLGIAGKVLGAGNSGGCGRSRSSGGGKSTPSNILKRLNPFRR